jgi:glucose-6-phosphate 1-dehydrogenase
MAESASDAFVFFGATGDLAYKRIFPALRALIEHDHFNVPIVGVAKAGWQLDQLLECAGGRVNSNCFSSGTVCGTVAFGSGYFS